MGILFALVIAIHNIPEGIAVSVPVYISLDELLPTAEKYGEHHSAIYGVIPGMVVMAFSLLMFV